MMLRAFVLATSLLWLTPRAFAGACLGDSLQYRKLPHTFGRPYDNLKNPLFLPCDTMIVAAGDSTVLNPGSMLHFGPRASEKNVIVVEGTLTARGGDQEPVYFSGTITESDFGLRPGTGRWGGFRVAPGGELRISGALIVNAEYAVESQSSEVSVSKSYLKGCSFLRGPGSSLPIDYRGTNVDFWDLAAPKASALGSKEEVTPAQAAAVEPVQRATPSRKLLGWSLAGLTAAAAGGGILWYLAAQEDGNSNHPQPGTEYSTRPDMPMGGPRSP